MLAIKPATSAAIWAHPLLGLLELNTHTHIHKLVSKLPCVVVGAGPPVELARLSGSFSAAVAVAAAVRFDMRFLVCALHTLHNSRASQTARQAGMQAGRLASTETMIDHRSYVRSSRSPTRAHTNRCMRASARARETHIRHERPGA